MWTTGQTDRIEEEGTDLFELFGEDGVEERIAARVERQDEDGEDFGLLERHELEAAGGRQREEGDGRPAQEVGEDEEGHPLGDARVVRVPRLRAPNGAVHLSPSIAQSLLIHAKAFILQIKSYLCHFVELETIRYTCFFFLCK